MSARNACQPIGTAMSTMIVPRYGTSFDARDLVAHIRKSGRTHIIQGQKACGLSDHPKPSSLDLWMRENGDPKRMNTKQADNDIVAQLVQTGLFRKGKFKCPDNGRLLKGLEIVS